MGILGIDLGTTGCKATLFNNIGQIMSTSYKEYKTIHLGQCKYELDPNVVWEKVQEVILECTLNSRDIIKGISVSSFGEVAVYLDEANKVVRNSILYTDSRGDEEILDIVEKLGERYIKKTTGLAVHKMYTLPKLLWVKNNEPKLYKKIKKVMLFGDYIQYCLSGKRFIDPALASRTMMFNIKSVDWDVDILSAFELDKSLFSEINNIGTDIGQVTDEISLTLNIDKHCQVFIGSHDQVCATIGSNAFDEKSAMLGMGTVSCVTPIFKKANVNLDGLKNYPIVPFMNNLTLTYVVNFTSGSLLRWFRDEIALHEMKRSMENSEDVYSILGSIMPEDPTELIVLPHFAGSGTPIMNPSSNGMIYGLKLETSRGSIYKSLMEGVAYELRYNLDFIEKEGIPLEVLYGTGGGTNSREWCQIISDITRKTVHVMSHKESGNIGLYAIVTVGLKRASNYREALKGVNDISETFIPSDVPQYKTQYGKYKKLYEFSEKF